MDEGYCEDCYLDRESLSASCSNVVFKALLIPTLAGAPGSFIPYIYRMNTAFNMCS